MNSAERKETTGHQNFDINFDPPIKACLLMPEERSVLLVVHNGDREIVIFDHRHATILAQKIYKESHHSPQSVAVFLEAINNFGIVLNHPISVDKKITEVIVIEEPKIDIPIDKISFVRFSLTPPECTR